MQVVLTTYEGKGKRYGAFAPKEVIPCLRCGVCCTKWQPPVDEEEITNIAKRLGIPPKAFCQDYLEPSPKKLGIYLLRRWGNGCIFLRYEGEKASCTIHSFRPSACRNWVASLSRPECLEGLSKRKGNGYLIQPSELYASSEELDIFNSSLKSEEQAEQ